TSGNAPQPVAGVVQITGTAPFPKPATKAGGAARLCGSSINNNASETPLVPTIRLVIAWGKVRVKFTVGAAAVVAVFTVPPVHVISRSLTRSVLLSARAVVFKLLKLQVIGTVCCALASPANIASTANAITHLRN